MFIRMFSLISLLTTEIICFKHNHNLFVENKLINYTNHLEMEFSKQVTVIVNTSPNSCGGIIDSLFANGGLFMNIIDNGVLKDFQSSLQFVKPKHTFIFLEKLEDIFEIVERLRVYTFWHARSFIHFIICQKIQDNELLPEVLKVIWKENVWNFVLVYVGKKLKVVSYNKFRNDSIQNLTNEIYNERNLFPNKIRNVNGYKFTVGISSDMVLNSYDRGKWFGDDINNLKTFTQYINGTAKIERLVPEFKKKVDFNFVRVLPRSEMIKHSEIMTSFLQDNLICLIPNMKAPDMKPKNLYLHTFSILATLMALKIVVAFITTFKKAFLKHFFEATSYCYNRHLERFSNKPLCRKLLFSCLIIFYVELSIIYQSELISTIFKPHVLNGIKTVDELIKTDMRIYVFDISYGNLAPKLKNISIPVSNTFLLESILRDETNGYIVTESYWSALLITQKSTNLSRRFRVMPEVIATGFSAYMLPKQNPYADEIKKFFRYFKSKMFFMKFDTKKTRKMLHQEINLTRSSDFLFILVSGLTVATVVFFLEIIWFNKNNLLVFIKHCVVNNINTKNV